MTKIAEIYARRGSELTFLCDFSPPRGAVYECQDAALTLDADCLSIPYNPGKSVYANSAMAAYSVKAASGKEVAFTIATRDMNILATESMLLGAALLGLENVVVVRGDDFAPSELRYTKPVQDRTPTALIRAISTLNEGADFRGRLLSTHTNFCIGAVVDTNRMVESEIALARRKIEAGAHFLITQPGFAPDGPIRFIKEYERSTGARPSVPIFFGIQMLAQDSRSFTPIPQSVQADLNAGVSAGDIASRAIDHFIASGITTFYLMPPIFAGGARDYESAEQVLNRFL